MVLFARNGVSNDMAPSTPPLTDRAAAIVRWVARHQDDLGDVASVVPITVEFNFHQRDFSVAFKRLERGKVGPS